MFGKRAYRASAEAADFASPVTADMRQYVKNGKDGGLLGYRMLVDAGVIPQKVGKHHLAMEPQKPVDLQPDSEQPRIRTIATEMVRRAVERRRFFAEPLREMDEGEEAIRSKK